MAQAQNLPTQLFSPGIETARKLIDIIIEFCIKYSFQAIGGIIIIIAGFLVAKFVSKHVEKILKKRHVDVTISKFLIQILRLAIIAFAVLMALGSFGITIAPFIAGLSVAGFGLSFALQGPLSNYAAGATLIFTKPFKVGDIIEVTEVMGEVVDMTLARTEIKTVDGTKIVIPNKQIIGEIIHNYTEYKKLDIKVGVDYGGDIEKAIRLVTDTVRNDKRIAQVPPPKVGISDFGDSSIEIYARIWCKQNDYWDVLFDTNKGIYDIFNKNKVSMPFPQIDVHMVEKVS